MLCELAKFREPAKQKTLQKSHFKTICKDESG